MIAYIDGRIDKDNSKVDFILGDLWFAPPDYDGDLEINEECTLVTGYWFDSVCEGTVYYTKWREVDVNGEEIFSVEELKEKLKGKHLINGMAMFNEDVDFSEITVSFIGCDGEWMFPHDRICHSIQFIVY